MNILLFTSLLFAATNADIGLKLRQQQQLLLNGGSSFGADARNNPFFIPKSDGKIFGEAGAAATNIEKRANGNAKTERTHTLEELCNDAFHSFLCKPVNGRRRRIDGNIRPGAMLPPGLLRPESSNTRENKLLPPQQSSEKQNNKQPFDLQVPAAQSEQGYFYPKPSNTIEVNKPLRNGYLPPDNGFRFTTPPPTFQTTRAPLLTTTRPTQKTRFPPFTFPPTTQRPLVTQASTTRQPVASNFDTRFQTTPRPIFTTPRIQTTRPVSIFTPSRQSVSNSYLPPVTVATRPPPTTRVPFFTRPSPSPPVFTTRRPPQTRPPPPPPTLPPLRFTSTTFRPSTLPPVTFFTSTPKYQTVPNTYLPPFAEQRLNPVFVSTTTTTPRPTFQTTFKPFTAPANTYLPPESPAIDVRFGSASNNREGSAILPEAAQNPSVVVKPDEEHNLERLCNDPFHSFLCLPITKTRYRFDGRLRPQAVIPQGVLLTSNSFNKPVKALPELQAGSNIQPTSVPSDSGYVYPSAIQQNQPFLGYVIPAANQQNLLVSANENSVSSSGYFYPAPSNNGLTSLSTSSSSQTGYEYPKPTNNQQFNFISSTLAPEISSVSIPFSTVSTTPKPLIQSNQFLQNNLLTYQNTNIEPLIVTTTEKSQSLESGYNYPKPSINQQFTFPSSTPSPVTFEYGTPKTETQFIYTTSTPRPSSAFETSTLGSSTFKYQPTGSFMFSGFGNSNPINGQGISISTTERPSTLVYEYQNQIINQVSPSLPSQTFINNYQKPSNQLAISSVSGQGADFNGYSYPKPEQPLQEQPTINNENGYYYPKPSLSFPENSLNSFGNSQFFKNVQNPIFNTFSKGISFSPNQPSLSTPSVTIQQKSFDQGADQKAAKNINQLLGPSNESNSRDLPPASQFEILKVRKRQNG